MRKVSADNESLERTDEGQKSQLISRKDVPKVLIGLGILGVFLVPIYFQMLGNTESYICKTKNMHQIAEAIGLYANSNDDRLPPLMAELAPNVPLLNEKGAAVTWTSLVEEYMKSDASFLCPSAEKDEGARVSSTSNGIRLTTYGLYAPLAGESIALIPNPDYVVLIAETSNYGANKTYNPFPYKDPTTGKDIPIDGFSIGFNDSNELPTPTSKFVTRLAFRDTNTGLFTKTTPARHDLEVHAISVTGMRLELKAPDAEIRMYGGTPAGHWAIPANLREKLTKPR